MRKEKNEIITSSSRIILEQIEEENGKYTIKFFYKTSGDKFPTEKIGEANNAKEAYIILDKFKDEYKRKVGQVYNLENNRATESFEKRKWYADIISFDIKNKYWWLGLILTFCVLILGVIGFLFVKNEENHNKSAYSAGVWKGMFIYSIISSILR